MTRNSPRSRGRRRQSAAIVRAFNARVESLETRQLLASFVVNDPLDLPDSNLNDGLVQTANGTISLRAIAEQQAHDNVTETLTISFASQLNIAATTANFSNFSVVMSGPGVTIGSPMSFGGNSTISGLSFSGGLNFTGSNNRVENNSISNGGVTITGTALAPSRFNTISGNTLTGGTGMLLSFVQDSTVSSNTVTGSTQHGIRIANGPMLGPALAGRNVVTSNRIGIDGVGTVLGNARGIALISSGNDTVGGATAGAGNLVVATQDDGIEVFNGAGFVIQGNLVGTNATGASGMGNVGDGISLTASTSTIGGVGDARNIVGGNGGNGIVIIGSGVVVKGNLVGTDATQTVAIGNGLIGISLRGNDNVVGGTSAGEANRSSANGTAGIHSFGSGTVILGNFVGGIGALGNLGNGISTAADHQTVGGTASNAGNIIVGNGQLGIFLAGSDHTVLGNRVGVDASGNAHGNGFGGIEVSGNRNLIGPATGTVGANIISNNGSARGPKGYGVLVSAGTGNRIRRNPIFNNSGRAIAFGSAGHVPNDAGIVNGTTVILAPDSDTGSNNLQNHPVALRREGNQIRWVLNSTPNSTFVIDIYSNTSAHPSGSGDATTHVQSLNVTTNAQGTVEFLTNIQPFMALTATNNAGNTSELSLIDSDLDGLPDAWETLGIDANDDGVIDLVLPGANPLHKDVYIEVDAMHGIGPVAANVPGLPAGLATNTTLDFAIQQFAQAPQSLVNNPDGLGGINLHVLLNETGLQRIVWDQTDTAGWATQFSTTKAASFGTEAERASGNAANILAARAWTHRYAIFADSLLGSGADVMVSDTVGSDIAVFGRDIAGSDGVFGTGDDAANFANTQGGLFQRGLEHSLGLAGGGDWSQTKYYFGEHRAAAGYRSPQTEDTIPTPPPPPTSSDLQISQIANAQSIGIGQTVTYTLTVRNNGPDAASTVFASQSLPANLTYQSAQTTQGSFSFASGTVSFNVGTLNSGAQATLTIVATANALGAAQTTAAVGPTASDPTTANNTSVLSVSVVAAPPTADVSIAQQANVASAFVGAQVTFTIVVQNNGSGQANDVRVIDTLPAGLAFVSAQPTQGSFQLANGVLTFLLGSLASGATATISLVTQVTAAGALSNAATVSAATNDPNLGNNGSNAGVTAQPRPVSAPIARVSTLKVNKRKKEKVIVLSFDGALNPGTVAQIGNYRLVAAGRDKKYGTKDDKVTRIKLATFDAATNSITIRTRTPLNLAKPLRLTVRSGGVFDSVGRPIDGNRDGSVGGDVTAIVSKSGVSVQQS